MFAYLLLGTLIATALYMLKRPNILRIIYLAEKFPGPLALPIIGNAYLFLNRPLAGIRFWHRFALQCV